MKKHTKFMIYASLHEEIEAGWVWLSTPTLPPRSIICIYNPGPDKKVYCEALQIDENFLRKYNDPNSGRHLDGSVPQLVMNAWYRSRLGNIGTKSEYELNITQSNCLLWKLLACIHHPQVVVRMGTWLGIIGILLGGISLVLGFK
jgi:hypothetical protein